ncbi:4-(cytidine 5'-diphospho)-2-C-methyl-D-erythritol kinase [Methylobacterium sp. WL93]|uniref:4-(cytidine 5'-diphospho)-2-C-methyl-D-erythritol kinase n=1 Tax=Methylobacterium sp. WL93 TaxID=2603892 RepID=UPI0011C9BAD2|nr:4-(cytidine 5'-diphospho)-2-C-methyl-D-erythritol kinase [Methylobacterium sp. WL93]TXN39747.1 4-(cytidine 5'-diphospho)-2-C-methyl-D-erythritol kinase [Methylobacterium sp. WL93]
MPLLTTRAPAKINLTLHVLGRRPGDGYHMLESLVAFAGVGDALTLDPGPELSLSVSGPTAGPAGPTGDNLVVRAAREEIGPALGMQPFPAVLINPGVPVPTAPVFKALGLRVGDALNGVPHPEIGPGSGVEALVAAIGPARNDLEAPALTVAPAIGTALAALRTQAGCRLARMSGSGATVFAVFADRHSASRAARAIGSTQPTWWTVATYLR